MSINPFVVTDDNKCKVKFEEQCIEILHKPRSFDPLNDELVRVEQLIVSKIKSGTEYSIILDAPNQIGVT